MSQLKITLEINTIAELDGLEAALDLFSESERERLDDEAKQHGAIEGHAGSLKGRALLEYKRDRARQKGAAQLLASVRGNSYPSGTR